MLQKVSEDEKLINKFFAPEHDFALTGGTNSFLPNYLQLSLMPCDQYRETYILNSGVRCETDPQRILEYFNYNPITFSWYDQYISTGSLEGELSTAGGEEGLNEFDQFKANFAAKKEEV